MLAAILFLIVPYLLLGYFLTIHARDPQEPNNITSASPASADALSPAAQSSGAGQHQPPAPPK